MSKKVKDYTLQDQIGQGAFGTVWKAFQDGVADKIFAVKQIEKKKLAKAKDLQHLQQEIAILQQISHENIVKIHPVIQTDNNIYIVMDYCEDGDLNSILRLKTGVGLTEKEALYYLKQILSAMAELQKRRVIHRDIKPANVLLHKGKIRLADFGFAKEADETSTRVGTPHYMAPEILFDNPNGNIFNSKVDIFSLGALYYEMLYGKLLFGGESVEAVRRTIKQVLASGSIDKSALPRISEESKDLLVGMLKFEATERITWEEIFNHPVFSEPNKPNVFGYDANESPYPDGTPGLQLVGGVSKAPTPGPIRAIAPLYLEVPATLLRVYIDARFHHEDMFTKYWLQCSQRGLMLARDIELLKDKLPKQARELAIFITHVSLLGILNTRIRYIEVVRVAHADPEKKHLSQALLEKDKHTKIQEQFINSIRGFYPDQIDKNPVLIEALNTAAKVDKLLCATPFETMSDVAVRSLFSLVGVASYRQSMKSLLSLGAELKNDLKIADKSSLPLVKQLQHIFTLLRCCLEEVIDREGSSSRQNQVITFVTNQPATSRMKAGEIVFDPTKLFDWNKFQSTTLQDKETHQNALYAIFDVDAPEDLLESTGVINANPFAGPGQ